MEKYNVLGFEIIKEKNDGFCITDSEGNFDLNDKWDYTVKKNDQVVTYFIGASEEEAKAIDTAIGYRLFPSIIEESVEASHIEATNFYNSFGRNVEREFFLGSLKENVEKIYLDQINSNPFDRPFNYSVLGKLLVDQGFNEDNILKGDK